MQENQTTDVRALLLSRRIRPSQQRVAIMEYLLSHKTHPTVDQIYEELSDSIPSLSKTTVYNTLTLFSLHGLAHALTIDARNLRFDGDTSAHAHFLCETCGGLYDIFLSEEQKRALSLLCGTEHEIFETQLSHTGVCKYCKEKNRR